MTTNTKVQTRRENAADRLRAALAPESGHRFGTARQHGYTDRAEVREFESGLLPERVEAAEAAEARARLCLRNLEAKNVRPA